VVFRLVGGGLCGEKCVFRLVGAAGRVGPGRPPRNSLAGLVRLNRCVRDVRAGQRGGQRFSQRCLARSDSRGNLPRPTRPTTALRQSFQRYHYASFQSYRCVILEVSLCVIPAKAGVQALGGKRRGYSSGRSGGSGWSGQAASKLPRGPRTAESLRAGRTSEAARRTTIQPTMPGSVRQSRQPARTNPPRHGTTMRFFKI